MKRARSDDNSDKSNWYERFVSNRNWRFCESFWSRMIQNSAEFSLSAYIQGGGEAAEYGVSSLASICAAGQKGEFVS